MAPIVAFDSNTNGKGTSWTPQLVSEPAATVLADATLHRPRSLDNAPKWLPAVIVAVIITGCCIIALVWKLIRDYYRRAHRPMSLEMPQHNDNDTFTNGPGGHSNHPDSGSSGQNSVRTHANEDPEAVKRGEPSNGQSLSGQPYSFLKRRLGDEEDDARIKGYGLRSSVVSSDYGNGSMIEISTARPMLLSPVSSTPAHKVKVVEISRPTEKATDDEGKSSTKDGEKTLVGMLDALKK